MFAVVIMGLLDILAEKMNCHYLSDLRYFEQPNAELRCIVANFSLEDFPEAEWISTVEYLCNVCCASGEDARTTILSSI